MLETFTFAELMQVKPALDAYANKLAGKQDAEDLVQDALLRAIEKQHLFKKGSNLKAWLMCIMHNKYVANLRYSLRRAGINLPAQDFSVAACIDINAVAEIGVIISEIEKAIKDLPQLQQDVIKCITFDGLSYDDCATTLTIPIGTVRSRYFRAHQTLKQILN